MQNGPDGEPSLASLASPAVGASEGASAWTAPSAGPGETSSPAENPESDVNRLHALPKNPQTPTDPATRSIHDGARMYS